MEISRKNIVPRVQTHLEPKLSDSFQKHISPMQPLKDNAQISRMPSQNQLKPWQKVLFIQAT
jgi:hypothetical protein